MRADWFVLGTAAIFALALFFDSSDAKKTVVREAPVQDLPSGAVTNSVSVISGERRSFGGYGCTVDCSGHEAGYEWAESNGVDDSAECRGNSESFIEGCLAYVAEQGGGTENDDAADDDDS
jgi:hypothetical protein